MDENHFEEKEFYVDPPNLPDNMPDEIVVKVWAKWDKDNRKERAKHKRQHTLSQKKEVGLYENGVSLIKKDGIWKQVPIGSGISGMGEDDYMIISIQQPKQGRYYRARGKRGKNRVSNKKKNTTKTQQILNKERKK